MDKVLSCYRSITASFQSLKSIRPRPGFQTSKSVVDSWWIEDGSLLPSQQSHPFPESCFNQSDQATAHIANKRRYAFFQDRYTNQGVFIPRVCSKRISGFDLFSSGMNYLCQVAFPFIGLFGTDRRMRDISNLDLKGVQFHCSRKRDCKQHGKDWMVRNSNQLMAGITQRLIPLSAGMENGDWKDF